MGNYSFPGRLYYFIYIQYSTHYLTLFCIACLRRQINIRHLQFWSKKDHTKIGIQWSSVAFQSAWRSSPFLWLNDFTSDILTYKDRKPDMSFVIKYCTCSYKHKHQIFYIRYLKILKNMFLWHVVSLYQFLASLHPWAHPLAPFLGTKPVVYRSSFSPWNGHGVYSISRHTSNLINWCWFFWCFLFH